MWLVEAAAPAHAQRWREQEGRWEFTGKMVVSPLQVEHWMERGFSRERAEELYAEATAYTVRTLGNHVYRYFDRMDEYWFNVPEARTENDLGEELLATGYYRYVCPNWKTNPMSAGSYMIMVGGTDTSDEVWWENASHGSSVGEHVDIMAPAVQIYTTRCESDTAYGDAFGSGTSFAAPQVAGLCALIWSYDPTLSAGDVRDLLYTGCDEFTGYDPDLHGHGRINAFNSLALASGDLWTRDPHPGEAGVSNRFKAAGATNGATVRFYYGSSTGQTAVSGCTNVNVGIDNASVLGTATAGSNGAAIFSATVPSGWAGQTRYLQAVDLSDCRVSNLIEITFPN